MSTNIKSRGVSLATVEAFSLLRLLNNDLVNLRDNAYNKVNPDLRAEYLKTHRSLIASAKRIAGVK